MVAHITEGTAFDKQGRPFRRRNYVPGIVTFAALAVVSLIIWVIALNRPPDVTEAAACNPPADNTTSDPTQSKLGEQVTRASMTEVGPANLADTKIRVLNASGQGGQAAEVAGQLRDLGFAEPTAENDPLYTNNRLACHGQIRFGPGGRAAAADGLAGGAVRRAVPGPASRQHRRPRDRHRLHRAGPQRRHRGCAVEPATGGHPTRRSDVDLEDPQHRLLIETDCLRFALADQLLPAPASASVNASLIPGAAATTSPLPAAGAPIGGTRTRAPASAAISAPAAQSHALRSSS